jgi:hypothetical protein
MITESISSSLRRSHELVLILAVVLTAQIPFEFRYTLFGLTNLQWTVVAFALAGIPLLIENWKRLANDRLVQAAALFVATQWAAAFYAPEFRYNASKAAVRFTAGWMILAVVRTLGNSDRIYRVWAIASVAAAAYGLVEYAGLGTPWLFRNEEFYIGQAHRLSGSFEYPNTAAAYYAMSLPIVYWTVFRPVLKWVLLFLLWCALILTFSKGALVAVSLVMLAAGLRVAPKVFGVGATAYALLLPMNPYMFEWIYGPGRNPVGAEYKMPWNKLQQQPDSSDSVSLQIRNTGFRRWRSQGVGKVGLAYRWLNVESGKFSPVHTIVTPLPHDIEPGQTADVQAAFQTPATPGNYLLALELFSHDFDWFSRKGLWPALVEADIRPSVARSVANGDLSKWDHLGGDSGTLTASVPRSRLWGAAIRMFLDHPFGVGPDNFRLEYGRYLGVPRSDTNIHSNNLYLELLVGSGVFGFVSFGLILLAVRWRREAACFAVAVFLIHGLVDVFLMTTPIYSAFWILLAFHWKHKEAHCAQ